MSLINNFTFFSYEMDCWPNLSNNPAKNISQGVHHPTRGLLQTTGSTVPTSSSDVSKGLSGGNVQKKPLMGPDNHETDTEPFRMEQKQKESYNLKDNLALLDESIADLNRTSSSENSFCFRTSDSFTFKMEEFSSLDKSDYDFGSYDQMEKGEPGNERLIEENTMDILQSLELPGSLSDLNEFCVTNPDAFFPSLAVEDTSLVDNSMLTDIKPVFHGKNINGNDKAHSQQTLEHNLNVPIIKTEKDADFIQLCTPGVIKQENERSGNCEMTTMSVRPGPSASLSMGSQSYSYKASTALTDQKPVLDLYNSLHNGSDGWSHGNGFGISSGMQRANKPMSQPCPSTYTYNR